MLEKVGFAKWINTCLTGDGIVARHIPITVGNDELFEKVSDGLILCQLVNYHFPNSIHTKAIIVDAVISRKNKFRNISLAFITAICYGCDLDRINVFQVFSGVKTVILEMLWQIFKIGFTYDINLLNYPEIIILRKSTETVHDLREVSSTELVLRYVNYHLSRSGSNATVNSFYDKFHDGSVYYSLVSKVFPGTNQSIGRCATREERISQRILVSLSILEEYNSNHFLTFELFSNEANHFVSSWKFHYLAMHWLFKNQRLELHEPLDKGLMLFEGNQEKFLRNYLNSFGIDLYCNDLAPNNRSSLLIRQLLMNIDRLEFKDRGFVKNFHENYAMSERVHNAALILSRLEEYKVKEDSIYPEMIAKCQNDTIKLVLVRLVEWWLVKSRLDIKQIKEWVNGHLKKDKISSFRDLSIYQKNIFAKVLDSVEPNNIDFRYLKCMEKNEFTQYYVSIARRCGYLIYTIPEQFMVCEHDYILIAFATLMYNRKHNNISCPEY